MRSYRIEWISLLTDYRGHGSWQDFNNRARVNEYIKELNKKYKGEIKHWIVTPTE